MSVHEIRYLNREDIDIGKWDSCIDQSLNKMIYAYSYYLDNMATHWAALILGDYQAVMPLTWNRKWGINYLYQPAFTQQLGIFSPDEIKPSLIERFLAELSFHFRFGEIFLNYKNALPLFREHTNFIIYLNFSYSDLYSKYKKDAVRNLKRAGKFHLRYIEYKNLGQALDEYRKVYGKKIPQLKNTDYENFRKLCGIAEKKGEIISRAVLGPEANMLSIAILLQKNNRLYLIQSTTLVKGRKVEANYFLIDRLIREFSGKEMVLDFEGSDIPGIAHFYRNFGGLNQPYFFYRFNRLPLWIKWMKPS